MLKGGRCTDPAHLPLISRLIQRIDHQPFFAIFDGCTVELHNIQIVGFQPPEAVVHAAVDILLSPNFADPAQVLLPVIWVAATPARQVVFITAVGDKSADVLFTATIAIGSINEVDSGIQQCVKNGFRLCFGQWTIVVARLL